MVHKYKLSICIPTYNREKYLKNLLDSIVSQKEFNDTNEVEIIVDDGPSTDNTESMVKEYIKKYGNKIKYFRNPKRIGMCPALLEAFSLGNGEYCWIFSSDDLMTSRTLEITLRIIKEHSPSLIFGREKSKGYLQEEIDDTIKIFNGMQDFSVYLGEKGGEKEKGDILTFVSSFCTKKIFFEKNLKYIQNEGYDSEYLKKNYFNFSLIGFSQIFSSDKIIVVENPIFILYTPDNGSWKPNPKIAEDLNTLLKLIKNKYVIPTTCKKFFNKLYFSWYINCTAIPYLKKIRLYRPLKYVYHKFFSKYI